LERYRTAETLKALLEEVRKGLVFETLRVRVNAEALPRGLNGVRDIEVPDPNLPRDPALLSDNGVPSWIGPSHPPRPRSRHHPLSSCCLRRTARCAPVLAELGPLPL
jgi:hypothetical protein